MTNEEIDYLITVATEDAQGDDLLTSMRQIERMGMRTLSIIRRISGGNESLATAISQLQRMIMLMRTAQIAYTALQTAMAASGNPLAIAGAIISGVNLGVTAGEMIYESTYGQ